MCQIGCANEYSQSGNCKLKGPCPYDMTEEEMEQAEADNLDKADHEYEVWKERRHERKDSEE